MIEVVHRVLSGGPDVGYYILVFEAPRVSDLFYWPPPDLVNATSEDIVDAALRYRPIVS